MDSPTPKLAEGTCPNQPDPDSFRQIFKQALQKTDGGAYIEGMEVLKIFDVFELVDGSIVIGLNAEDEGVQDQWRAMGVDELKALFEGKQIRIKGKDQSFQASVMEVEILNSISEFKNVFLKLERNQNTLGIRMLDEVGLGMGFSE